MIKIRYLQNVGKNDRQKFWIQEKAKEDDFKFIMLRQIYISSKQVIKKILLFKTSPFAAHSSEFIGKYFFQMKGCINNTGYKDSNMSKHANTAKDNNIIGWNLWLLILQQPVNITRAQNLQLGGAKIHKIDVQRETLRSLMTQNKDWSDLLYVLLKSQHYKTLSYT